MKIPVLFLLTVLLCACAAARPLRYEDQSEQLRLVDQGTSLLRQGKLEQAWASFQVAAEVGGTPAAYDGLGCVAFLEGNYAAAEELFIKAYNSDNTYTAVLGNLALLYEAQGKTGLARSIYERAVAVAPRDYRLRNNFSIFLLTNFGSEKALARLELNSGRALSGHPLIEHNWRVLQRRRTPVDASSMRE